MRERGNIWPLISVAAGALFVLVIVPLIIERNRSGRMATVDAQVSIGDAGSGAVFSLRILQIIAGLTVKFHARLSDCEM